MSPTLPLQLCGKPKRRIRMFQCPYCGGHSPLEPKARGEDFAVSVCHSCLMAVANDKVFSYLQDPN